MHKPNRISLIMYEKIEIIRLKRVELASETYKRLIESLFVNGRVDERVHYAKWLFEDNPALKNEEDLPIYLCRVNGKDAGQLAIIPVEVVFADKPIRGGWCVDFHIKPDFQRRGIGKKLLRAAFKEFPLLMTLGQTDASFELFSAKLGWHYNDNRLTNYKTLLNPFLLLLFLVKKTGLLKRRRDRTRTAQIEATRKSGVKPLNSFEEIKEMCDLHKGMTEKSTSIPRTIEFFKWRYFRHPFIKYRINCITVEDSYNIYIVWRMFHDGFWQCASIVDILYKDNLPLSVMKTAIKKIMNHISSYGVEIFECNTSDPVVINSLPRKLLSSNNPGKRFLYGMIDMEKCPLVPNEEWKLYSGDCDVETLFFGEE